MAEWGFKPGPPQYCFYILATISHWLFLKRPLWILNSVCEHKVILSDRVPQGAARGHCGAHQYLPWYPQSCSESGQNYSKTGLVTGCLHLNERVFLWVMRKTDMPLAF